MALSFLLENGAYFALALTFGPVIAVLLFPLIQQDVEVSGTLKEAKVAWWSMRWENALKLSSSIQFIFALGQHADVLGSQNVQHWW